MSALAFVFSIMCTPPSAAVAQAGVDLVPYAGLYVPTASLTSAGVLKQSQSVALGSRLTVWLRGRVGIEGTVNYAPSGVTPAQAMSAFPGPSSAHIIAKSAKAILRLSPKSDATVFHVGGGIGSVGYRGAAYGGDVYLQANGTTFSGGIVSAGAEFKFGRPLVLRLDAEDYVFRAHFQCRRTQGTPGVCWAVNQGGSNTSSKLQDDLVLSLGLAIRLAGR